MSDLSRRDILSLLGGLGASVVATDLFGGTCGPPPPAKKQRWKAAESFPPLPLPATPLRRSEKKRPPAPPVLIGKIQYGKTVTATDRKGRRYSYRDWTTDPGDIRSLMHHANRQLGVRYRPTEISFTKFSFKPQEVPILFLTGHEGFEFTDEQRALLRRYLHDGGTLIGDACCGMEPYRKAFLQEIVKIFPQRKMKILAMDHPVYTAYHAVRKVGYHDEKKGDFEAPPVLEGITIGTREAVFLSQYDLSCAWDGHRHDRGKRVWPAEGAVKLGVNLIAYCLATYRLGQYLATSTVYHDKTKGQGGGLVVGQIVHGGDWDPNPSGIMNLMKHASLRSTMSLRFARTDVNLAEGAALRHPVLYMTGMEDFTFTPTEIARLRQYLLAGGTLFADACGGRNSFDKAFRREIAKVIPNTSLERIPASHPVFTTVIDSRRVRGAPALDAKRKGKGVGPVTEPEFEGIRLGGHLAVIYSPLGVGNGWEDEMCPYAMAYAPESARDLGLNVLAYALTH